jgi:hypothetical protein
MWIVEFPIYYVRLVKFAVASQAYTLYKELCYISADSTLHRCRDVTFMI